jgi:hypothetical protein
MKLQIAILFAVGTAVACGEPLAPGSGNDAALPIQRHQPRVAFSQSTAEYWEEGSQQAPADAPPEYQVSSVLTINPDVSFISDGYAALGEVVVHYFGTGASADVQLSVSKGDTPVGTPANGHMLVDGGLPRWGDLTAIAMIDISGTCGYSARADAAGGAWIGWGGQVWGKMEGTANKSASQPACLGGGGGSYGYVLKICTTTYYFSGSGEYLGDSQECEYEEHAAM